MGDEHSREAGAECHCERQRNAVFQSKVEDYTKLLSIEYILYFMAILLLIERNCSVCALGWKVQAGLSAVQADRVMVGT